MVSADVVDSMNQILPKEQNLLPISFKRKIDYTGHYMQEYVDRKKLEVYFRWFQRHNHLFKDMKLDENLIDKFESEAQKTVAYTFSRFYCSSKKSTIEIAIF